MAQPYQLTVAETAQQIKDNQLSPVELAQSLLERIDATDKELQSWVTIDREEVLTTAKQLENEAKQGHSRGLLHGVPVGLKDIFYTSMNRQRHIISGSFQPNDIDDAQIFSLNNLIKISDLG